MMSGPFFLFMYSFKYIGRFAVLYYLYRKAKNAATNKVEEISKEETVSSTT
jgi:hypothetical protein